MAASAAPALAVLTPSTLRKEGLSSALGLNVDIFDAAPKSLHWQDTEVPEMVNFSKPENIAFRLEASKRKLDTWEVELSPDGRRVPLKQLWEGADGVEPNPTRVFHELDRMLESLADDSVSDAAKAYSTGSQEEASAWCANAQDPVIVVVQNAKWIQRPLRENPSPSQGGIGVGDSICAAVGESISRSRSAQGGGSSGSSSVLFTFSRSDPGTTLREQDSEIYRHVSWSQGASDAEREQAGLSRLFQEVAQRKKAMEESFKRPVKVVVFALVAATREFGEHLDNLRHSAANIKALDEHGLLKSPFVRVVFASTCLTLSTKFSGLDSLAATPGYLDYQVSKLAQNVNMASALGGAPRREAQELLEEVGALLDQFTRLTSSVLDAAQQVVAEPGALTQAVTKAFSGALAQASIPVLKCSQEELQALVAERLGSIADGTAIKPGTLEKCWALLREGLFVFRNNTDVPLRFILLPSVHRQSCLRVGKDGASIVLTPEAAAEVGLSSADEVAVCPFDARELSVNGWPSELPTPLGFVDVFSAVFQTGTSGRKALSTQFPRLRTIPITFLTSGTILGRRTGMSWENLRAKTDARLGWGMSLRDTANLFLKAGSRVAVSDIKVKPWQWLADHLVTMFGDVRK